MKKKKLVFAIIFIVILFVIFKVLVIKSNKIVCKSVGKTKDLNITQKYTIKYSENDITSIEIIKIYKYMNDDMFKKFEITYNNTLSNYESLKNSYLNYSGSISKDTYKIELNVDVSDMKEEDLNGLGLGKDFKSMKTQLENQGLICK